MTSVAVFLQKLITFLKYITDRSIHRNQINISSTAGTLNVYDYTKSSDIIEEKYKFYTAVIVEPRKHHKALKYVLTNFLENLNSSWNIIVYHGADKEHKIFEILNGTKFKTKYQDRVTLVNLNLKSLATTEYSRLLYTKKFYDAIPTEVFLVFQTDSAICSKQKHYINEFFQYDYVGAPWDHPSTPPGVGNGGLSLRRKSKMLQMLECETISQAIQNCRHEDDFFSTNCRTKSGVAVKVNKPSSSKAMNFSVETAFKEKSFGAHKPCAWLKPDQYQNFTIHCPEIEIVRKLNA